MVLHLVVSINFTRELPINEKTLPDFTLLLPAEDDIIDADVPVNHFTFLLCFQYGFYAGVRYTRYR